MGIAGDMAVASLLHVSGLETKELKEKLKLWNFPLEAEVKESVKNGIYGFSVSLEIKDKLSEVFYRDVEGIIKETNEKSSVKDRAIEAFRALFEAEGKAHGRSYDTVHLHEAASWDAIFDIFTTSWLIEVISPDDVLHSPVNVGGGIVETAHGVLPVPPPAVAELLKGRTIFSAGPETELTTPTGAAILRAFAKEGKLPEGRLVSEGRGFGTKSFKGYHNFLRTLLLDEGNVNNRIVEIEAEIDDSTGEILSSLWEELEEDALDMFFIPVYMKKGRPGVLIKVISRPNKLEQVAEKIFLNTTTIGIRYSFKDRIELKREIEEIVVEGERVKMKIAFLNGKIVNVLPEFDTCKKLAKKLKISVKKAYQMILSKWRNQ